MAESIRMVIADDHPLFRGALREAVSGLFEDVEIAEAGSFDDVTKLLERGAEVIGGELLASSSWPAADSRLGVIASRSFLIGISERFEEHSLPVAGTVELVSRRPKG